MTGAIATGRTAGALRALCLAAPLLFGACANPTGELTVADVNRASFELEVYPVLLRDCGFHGCHGSTDRFLQTFGPGRGRLTADLRPLDPASPAEIEHTYQRARSLLEADPAKIDDSELLRKPLAVEAGGAGHEGVDDFGRDVYQSTSEDGFEALRNWALVGLSETATAVPTAPGGATSMPTPTGATQP